MNKPIRHGENLLLPVNSIPEGAEAHSTFIVGHSETGHHHVLESDTAFDVVVAGEDMFIETFEPALLVHKKEVNRHNDIVVQPGKYVVKRKREYDPFQQVMRQVWD